MNALQGYGSDSDEESQVQATKPGLIPSSVEAGGQQVDQTDIFGLKRLRDEEPSGEASNSGQRADNQLTDVSSDPKRRATGSRATQESPAESSRTPQHGSNGTSSALIVRSAPEVVGEIADDSQSLLMRPTDDEMHVNLTYEQMNAPISGPSDPFSHRKLGALQNTLSGHVETAYISEHDFRQQQKSFNTLGFARNPSLFAGAEASSSPASWIGDRAEALRQAAESSAAARAAAKERKKKREGAGGDLSVVDGDGAYVGPWAGWEGESTYVPDGVGPSEEEIKAAEAKSTNRKSEQVEIQEKRVREEAAGTEKSVFHGKSLFDYQGRTYMHVPTDLDRNLHGEAGSQQCYLPKACIHTFTGHTKGVSAIRLLPKSGHLMLSASMDTKVKLWDIYHEGNCLRTFMGHSQAVRDITFSNDGSKFLSAGYDRQVKLWDTETGQCIRAFSNGKVPNVIRFNPDENKQNLFLAGMADKKILQYDVNSGEITQEYNQHLGGVNTITFVDDNRRFVTTSDDKTLRAWDFDIPVTIKYVADPLMHSMPAVTQHPNKKWLAAQSLDNQIVVYAADSFRQNRKKVFKGHNGSGYACQIGFSPDGKFLSSGDGDGNLVFWDWRGGRVLKRLRAHREVVITHEWLPHETSKVVTGSWDGSIKLWD